MIKKVPSASKSQPQALIAHMEAISDPTRLRLLRLLERHELGVVELCDVLQLPQSTVSRHLKILADGQWVQSRRQGTTHLYRTLLDELDPAARKLWLLAREQTDAWATVQQDALRLTRRFAIDSATAASSSPAPPASGTSSAASSTASALRTKRCWRCFPATPSSPI